MTTVAIVDDKLIVRKAIRDKLNFADVHVSMEAASGKEFIGKAKELNEKDLPEIVLMDIEMPEMDGIKTIAVGSVLFPTIRFIVLSVFDNTEKIFEAIKAGASGYLLKDDDAISLKDAIQQVAQYNAVPMSPAIARKTLGLLKSVVKETDENIEPDVLSKRENNVLKHLIEGLEYKQIADRLFISPATVRTHINNIYKKLHINSKAQAIQLANKNGWI